MNRKCGSCTLCCRLVPVRELGKGANERCQHQSSKGCAVYHRPPAFPACCGLWSCRWLVDPQTEGLRRPDRTGYVLDLLPDMIRTSDQNTGEEREIIVLQVWVDPNRPDAWRDPALLRYADKLARDHGIAMLLRYSTSKAVTVFAPPLCTDGQWHEVHDGNVVDSPSGSLLMDALREEQG